MSDLLRELRVRVAARVKPLIDVFGDDYAVVRAMRLVLQDAEEIEQQLGEQRVTTMEAAERTGWAPETLQKRARQKLAGEQLPPEWARMIVELVSGNYVFVIDTIPKKGKA